MALRAGRARTATRDFHFQNESGEHRSLNLFKAAPIAHAFRLVGVAR
jgi:hypothetical protein